jgi:hypothetical protein
MGEQQGAQVAGCLPGRSSQAPPRSPGRYGASASFDMVPSAPSLHACRKKAGPLATTWSLNWSMPGAPFMISASRGLALKERLQQQILATEMEKIEDVIDEPRCALAVAGRLHEAEGRGAVRSYRTEFAIEIGARDRESLQRFCGRRILARPVETRSRGDELHTPAINPGVHAVAVEFQFVRLLAPPETASAR